MSDQRAQTSGETRRMLADRVRELEDWFDGLKPGLMARCPVLEEIAGSASGSRVATRGGGAGRATTVEP